jgi:hypothetical protein
MDGYFSRSDLCAVLLHKAVKPVPLHIVAPVCNAEHILPENELKSSCPVVGFYIILLTYPSRRE